MITQLQYIASFHRWAMTAVTWLVFALLVSGCDQGSRSSDRQFESDADILGFLKANYFEVPDTPIQLDDFEYTLLDGNKELFSSNRGKLVFLNFWAIWCYPCRKEMPDMQVLAKELEGEPFRMLAINYGEESTKVSRFAEKQNYLFDIVLDNDKSISSKLFVTGLPTTLILDTRGRFLGRLVGPADWKKDKFLEFFRALSRKQP